MEGFADTSRLTSYIDQSNRELAVYNIFDIGLESDLRLPELPTISSAASVFRLLHGSEEDIARYPFTWVHDWTNDWGEITITASRFEDIYLLCFPGMIDFLIDIRRNLIVYHPESDLPETTIRHLFMDQVMPRVLGHQHKLVLHASAVCLENHSGIAFLGDSGCGKSTLAASFLSQNATLQADDCLLLEASGGEITGLTNYLGSRLFDDSANALFDHDYSESYVAHYTEKKRVSLPSTEAIKPERVPLRALFILNDPYDDDVAEDIVISPLTGSSGLMSVARQTFSLDVTDKQVIASHFATIGKLVTHDIDIYRLSYPREHDCLPLVQNAILNTVFT